VALDIPVPCATNTLEVRKVVTAGAAGPKSSARIFAAMMAAAMLMSAACAPESRRADSGEPETALPDRSTRLTTPAIARQAFWAEDGNAILIRYETDQRDYFAVADRFHEQNVSPHGNWESVVFAAQIGPGVFAERAADAEPIAVLSSGHYRAFILQLADRLLPPEPNAGILLNRADSEFFFYRDGNGSVQMITGMINKPPEIRLAASYRVETLGDLVAREAELFLTDLGVAEQTVILSTNETGPYARPFAIFDRRTGARVFVSLEPFRFGTVDTNLVEQTGKTAWNVGRSYWWDFWNRPVSNLTRGVLFALDTVRDTTRELSIKVFEFPDLADDPIEPLHEGPGMDLASWEAYLDTMFGDQSFLGSAKILIGGDQFFPRLIDDLQNASEYIQIRTYIFDNDDFALTIADLLRKRSRDVNVQIMLDSLGTQFAQTESPATLPEGTETAPAIMHYLEVGSKVNVRPLTNPWLTGDHSKSVSVDGRIAYVGGMNIGREYRWEWHDLMVQLTGPVVGAIDYEFDKTWAHATMAGDVVYPAFLASSVIEHGEPRPGDYPIRILTTLPRESQILRSQLYAIRRAESYAWVENAYFASTRILYELAKARHRGVDVRVILPVEGDTGIMNKSNVVAANTLLKHGVRVYIYPGMSHVKAAIYDGWACLGSANFDKLSFRVNKELNLGISDPGFVQSLKNEVFETDMARSVELTEPLPEDLSNTLASIIAGQL
jgi:cardiolipin synthase